MIHWHERIYLSENVKTKYGRIRSLLDEGKSVAGLYVISLAYNPVEQLDISGAFMFLGQCELHDPTVVGLAKGKKEAEELVALMAFDAYNEEGKVDFRSFFA